MNHLNYAKVASPEPACGKTIEELARLEDLRENRKPRRRIKVVSHDLQPFVIDLSILVHLKIISRHDFNLLQRINDVLWVDSQSTFAVSKDNEPYTIKTLAQVLGIPEAKIGNLINRLGKVGLVSKVFSPISGLKTPLLWFYPFSFLKAMKWNGVKA